METIENTNNIVETKILHLSSLSDSGEVLNGDFKSAVRYNIPDAIVYDDTIEYIYWSIPFCIIPNSNYIINETNNRLDILMLGITTSYYFEFGNYNANLFISKFKSIVPSSFNISLNSINNKFTITNTTNDFSLLTTSTLDYIIGFSDTLSSVDKSISCPRSCNFLPIPRINITCPQLSNSSIMSNINDISNIILSVPNNAKLNGQIIYQNVSHIKKLFKNDRFDNFTISLCDDNGTPINFNGISFYMSIQFDICRKRIQKPMDFRKLIKMINENINNEE